MIQRKDLILSMIEEMGKALAKLINKQQADDQKEMDYTMDELLSLMSLDLHTVRAQNPIDIIQILNDPRLKPYLIDALNIYLSTHEDPQLRNLYDALVDDLKQDKTISLSDYTF